jgi:predicted permease
MDSIILSLEAVAPIFILMLVGYFIKLIKIADKSQFDAMNRLVFKLFLPVLLFYNIYKTDNVDFIEPRYIIFTVLGILSVFLLGIPVAMLCTKDNSRRGVMLQGFFRSNFAILGIPLVGYICNGEGGGLTSLMVAVVVPLFNVLAVISLEIFRGNTIDFWKILKGILKNPLIIGCVVGIIFLITGIKLPQFAENAIEDISSVASPLAIVVLGASFTFSGLKGYVKDSLIVVLIKLVISPLVILAIAAKLGFTGESLACLLVVFGSPVAVSSFAMSQQMGGDEKLSAQVIVISSVLCIFTLFVWIFTFTSLGLM